MGFFDKIRGSDTLKEAKVVQNKDNQPNIEGTSKYDFPDLELDQFIDYASFSKFRELSSDRKMQYAAYDDMTRDILISSALELYADDASQYDNSGKLVWVESSDSKLAEYLNNLLDTFDIAKNLWTIYYNLAEYGDVYIRLFKKPKGNNGQNLNEYLDDIKYVDESVEYENFIEIVDNPEDVFDLVKNGKTCQYAVVNDEVGKYKQSRIELYPPDQFIHIYIENPHIRDKEVFEFTTIDKDTREEKFYKYKVRRGKSMLYDIYAVEKEIQLLENSLLLNRLSKSAVTRIISLEVGDMPKSDVRKLTRRVKNVLKSKLSINKVDKSIHSYVQTSGLDNIVVNPTRNGKGNISVENVGGDVDVKSLLDLDYFNDKRFGGLKIPKAFLGYDEYLGSNAGGTLTRLDARYGRTIKRLQTCVVSGITDLLNLYLLHSGQKNKIDEFKVKVVSPTTVDDTDRDEQLSNKLNIVTTILSITAEYPDIDKNTLFSYLVSNYLNDPELSKIVSDGFKKKKSNSNTQKPDKPSELDDLNKLLRSKNPGRGRR